MLQKSNINWQDLHYFLAMVRSGSARATAQQLGSSHSTITRRIDQLESSLGTKLFQRDVSGFKLTEQGETLVHFAEQAESAIGTACNLIQGLDAQLSGAIRVTTSDAIANHLLMPMITSFSQTYPDIDIEVVLSSQVMDLNEREVDIALRILPNNMMPPEPLIGRMVGKIATCYYATPAYLAKHDPWTEQSSAKLIGWGELGRYPEWIKTSPFAHLGTICRLNHSAMQVEAAKSGLGIARLPCFIGDKTPELIRVPNCKPDIAFDIWMLSHHDSREVARIRAFKTQLVDSFAAQNSLLLGQVESIKR
ncbi:LysR family transcriptional regulator [Pseudoalteromonas luteoviolacea]|uniref:LysR family transcriptional regulator n=1 Tax=Pseudoalteromonas luteoviolacea TaxID=43657 RepID=UPI001B36198E|nr:LysR family transcriptional regulator [Pseudoalteromonas luteoviolacea]MBQ4813678.1 LysR family transcriptional regulator [Pseudoalteromonas luteoviolacea]